MWPHQGAVPQEGRPYENPHTQANQRAVGRGLGEEAWLLLVGGDRKFGRGCDRVLLERPVGGAAGLPGVRVGVVPWQKGRGQIGEGGDRIVRPDRCGTPGGAGSQLWEGAER